MRHARSLASLTLGLVLAACGGSSQDVASPPSPTAAPTASASAAAGPPVRVAFEIPRNGAAPDPFRTPWPTEMARLPDGHLDLRAYPGRDSALIAEYLARAAEDLDGFSIAPVVYFRFEGPIDLGATAKEDVSRSAHAPISLVDVDPASPEKGTFYPLGFRATTRDMRYVKAGTLAVMPLGGFALRPGTLYAAVVRRGFGDRAGGLRSTADLDAVVAKSPRADAVEERARALHAPAVEALEGLGVPRDDIAAIAVFRTGVPHAAATKMLSAIDALLGASQPAATSQPAGAAPKPAATASVTAKGKKVPVSVEVGARMPPRIVKATWLGGATPHGYRVMLGNYCTPNFQDRIENAPFIEREGGRVLTDGEGRPLVAPVPASASFAHADCPGQLRARFVLTVPDSPMPKDGYPLLVTAHGTGGSALGFVERDDFAGWAAAEGFAAIATDQPLNGGKEGGRPGAVGPLVLPLGIPIPEEHAGPPVAFYNPLYPGTARGNLQQAMADAAVLVRLFGGLDFATARDDKGQAVLRAAKGEVAPRFDARRTVLAGHSQGCQSIAVLGAVDPRARGVLLSGCGGDVRLGILYRRMINVTPWIALTLGLDPEELSPAHPLLALVQNLADPIDPLAFGRYYWDPLPGHTTQRILHIEGLRDGYSPEVAAEALAVALRVQPRFAMIKPMRTLELSNGPLSPDRQIAQFEPKRGNDGHFVLYDDPKAAAAFREFLIATAPP